MTTVTRETKETQITLSLEVKGKGLSKISTGVGFLDHMLEQIIVHGLLDLRLKAVGDLHVDNHHTVEDCALALGMAIDAALGDKKGIVRMSSAHVPMDEALGFVAIDFSGRSYSVVDGNWNTSAVGGISTSLIDHFFESLSTAARCNLHARILYGRDDHHQAEALFKALGRALDGSTRVDQRRSGKIPSTKGVI